MAADLPFLPDIPAQLATLGAPALIYCTLITTVALAAVFSSKPSRRKAALKVLRLLLPGRRRPSISDSARLHARKPTRPRRHRLPPADP